MTADERLKSLREAEKRRLYPRITDPNWLVLRRRRDIFCKWLNELSVQNPRVLDVGGRIQPYRELIATPKQYWSMDLRPSERVNAVAEAEQLPFADDSFDLVLCTQMIEYALQPSSVVNEIHRVLRAGGTLLLSAPSIFPPDSENDRWRFFPSTLGQLLTQFSNVRITPETGSAAGFLRTIAVFCHMASRVEALRLLLRVSVIPVLNCVGALIQMTLGVRDGFFTVNYSVRARK